MTNKFEYWAGAAAASLLLVSACGQQGSEAEVAEQPASEAPVVAEQPAAMPRTASAEGAAVFFITPADGETVPNPISIEFGIAGMSVVAAGVNERYSGHHHLLVDTNPPEMGLPIPADAHHIHFGDASTSTELTLAPGEHTLRLLLGDHLHIPHDPPVISETITITVE
jgi:Domain of unknown function (DUF4399)